MFEWETEVDELSWVDQGTAYLCKIKRAYNGVLCGYVEVSEDHPLYSLDINSKILEAAKIDVHGDITFAGQQEKGCGGWCFGFDCGHAGDSIPFVEMNKIPFIPPVQGIYRNIEFAKNECKKMALQLKKFEK